MSEQLQLRRGTATQVSTFTGAQGETIVDTTNNRLVVQDGTTAGGWPAAKLGDNAVAFTGGTINGVTIGGTTPEPASVTAPALGDSSSRAITSAWYGQNLPGGLVNKFPNGTMDVWQRGTSSSITTSGGYSADGWIVLPSGASVSAAQAGGRLLTKNSLQVTGASSVTDVIVKQRIESYIAAAFCSQTVTVQAQVYNNTGVAITPLLTVKHAGSQDVWTSPTTDVSAAGLQSCANASWTQVAYTFSASASAYNGLEVSFDFGNNFGSSGKDIQITELDIRATPGVAAGLNSNPPPPELRPIHSELAFCQRYFATSYANGVGQGAATHLGMVSVFIVVTGSFDFVLPVEFPNQMRAAPASISYWDGAGNASKLSTTGIGGTTFTDNGTNSGSAAFNISPGGFGFIGLVAATTEQSWIHYSASAEL